MELRLHQGGGGLVLQRGLRDVHQFTERGGILCGDVGENLAVETDLRGFQTAFVNGVQQPVSTLNPLTVTIGSNVVVAMLKPLRKMGGGG